MAAYISNLQAPASAQDSSDARGGLAYGAIDATNSASGRRTAARCGTRGGTREGGSYTLVRVMLRHTVDVVAGLIGERGGG